MIEHEKVLDMNNNLDTNKNDAGFNLLELAFAAGPETNEDREKKNANK